MGGKHVVIEVVWDIKMSHIYFHTLLHTISMLYFHPQLHSTCCKVSKNIYYDEYGRTIGVFVQEGEFDT